MKNDIITPTPNEITNTDAHWGRHTLLTHVTSRALKLPSILKIIALPSFQWTANSPRRCRSHSNIIHYGSRPKHISYNRQVQYKLMIYGSNVTSNSHFHPRELSSSSRSPGRNRGSARARVICRHAGRRSSRLGRLVCDAG